MHYDFIVCCIFKNTNPQNVTIPSTRELSINIVTTFTILNVNSSNNNPFITLPHTGEINMKTGREIKEELAFKLMFRLAWKTSSFLLFTINRIIYRINQVTRSPTEKILRIRWSIMHWKHRYSGELPQSTYFIQCDIFFLFTGTIKISNRTKLGIIF